MGTKRFVDWSFDHYLRIAPPEYAGSKWADGGSADDEHRPGQEQDDAEDATGAERSLV